MFNGNTLLGVGTVFQLTLIFFKLFGFIAAPWVWIFAPTWLPMVVVLFVAATLALFLIMKILREIR